MKLLILGNSITHHSPAPQLGWEGDWGMAASCAEHDFVHRLASMLEGAGKTVLLRERNVADIERGLAGDLRAYLADELAFAPEVVVLRISENTPGERNEEFAREYTAMIRMFSENPACSVFAVGPFWKNDAVEALLRDAADRCGAYWVSLSALHGKDEYTAKGQFSHEGVAGHPSDAGMQAIADIIFGDIRDAGLLCGAHIAPIPDGEPVYEGYTVTVDGIPAALYQARVSAIPLNRPWPGHQRPIEQSELASVLTFDMTAPVDLTLTASGAITDAVVRPLSKGVGITWEGNTAAFTIREPGQYSVEINGRHHNLHLFANAPEENIPKPEDCTHYFAPGIHEVGNLVLASGARVYLAAGAVVYGAIQAYDAQDIRIWGRGILDYSKLERHDPLHWEEDGIVNLVRCENITIDGIILRDASWWTITSFNCVNLTFRNCKAVGMWRYNADGFDFVNCQNVRVDGCFLRNFDDVVVFKGLRLAEMAPGYNDGGVVSGNGKNRFRKVSASGKDTVPLPYEHMNVQNFIVENCVLWCDWGGAMEIGAETVADEYSNLIYRNCDIIRADQGAMRIQCGDRAHIHNVLYENIRVEYSKYDRAPIFQHTDDTPYNPEDKPWVCDVIRGWVYCNMWTQDGILGEIYDITYRNISISADEGLPCPAIVFNGGDETHRVHDIRIEGVTFNGNPVTPPLHTNSFTDNIVITNGGEPV